MKAALFFLTIGTFSGAGLTFLTQVVLARNLPTSEFGAFSSALALVTLVVPLAGFGIAMFWLKVFGEEGWQAQRWIKPSLRFVFISSVLAVLIIYSWALFAPHDPLSRNLLFVLALFVVGQAIIELASAIYQLEERYLKLAAWQFLPHAMRFILVLVLWLVLTDSFTALSAASIYAITSGMMMLVGTAVLIKVYQGRLALEGHSNTQPKAAFEAAPSCRQVLHECWPFGMAGVFYLVYFQSSIVLVKYMLNNEAAAQYGIAIVIMTAIYLFPSIIYQKLLLPKIHRWANHDRKKLVEIYRKGNVAMLSLGVMVSIGVYLVSPYLIPLVFGENYRQAVQIMGVLVFAIPFRFVATSVGAMLVTHAHMRRKVFYMGGSAFVSLVIGYVTIPRIGVLGAAYAAIVTEAVQLLVYYFSVKITVFKNV